jgi:hypothetical protein
MIKNAANQIASDMYAKLNDESFLSTFSKYAAKKKVEKEEEEKPAKGKKEDKEEKPAKGVKGVNPFPKKEKKTKKEACDDALKGLIFASSALEVIGFEKSSAVALQIAELVSLAKKTDSSEKELMDELKASKKELSVAEKEVAKLTKKVESLSAKLDKKADK